jgi:hypothetical protein
MNAEEKEKRKKLFLHLLFTSVDDGGAGGNAILAKNMAGYSENTSVKELISFYKEDIEEATKQLIAEVAPESVFSIVSVMRSPVQVGSKEKLAAAKDLLDRAGFVKTEKVDVTSSGGLFILPAKEGAVDE